MISDQGLFEVQGNSRQTVKYNKSVTAGHLLTSDMEQSRYKSDPKWHRSTNA
jgi:hypothetical protein